MTLLIPAQQFCEVASARRTNNDVRAVTECACTIPIYCPSIKMPF